MQTILNALLSFWELIVYVISGMRLVDVLDIIVITFIIYKCIGFFRQTRGGQLVKGLVVLLVMVLIVQWFDMVMVKWLLVKLMDSILIVAVIIFQPEIRRALEQVGTSRIGTFGRAGGADFETKQVENMINSVSKAAGTMQEQKCGALMILERTTQLGEIIATGTVIDAKPSSSLICNIFYPKSPLHDGGMILRGGKVHAAGCILPLTQNSELSKALGTRHRAALGMSENSDAVVVVVSEETGTISVAVNGELRRDFDAITLQTELTSLLLENREKKSGGFFARLFGGDRQNGADKKRNKSSAKKHTKAKAQEAAPDQDQAANDSDPNSSDRD